VRAELGSGDGCCDDAIGEISLGGGGTFGIDLGGGVVVSTSGAFGSSPAPAANNVFGVGAPAPSSAFANAIATMPAAPLPRLGTTRERLASGAFTPLTQSFIVAPQPAAVPSTGTRNFLATAPAPMSTGKKVALAVGGVGVLALVGKVLLAGL
jgi:hypothetical protein